jgi:hypothetical protein
VLYHLWAARVRLAFLILQSSSSASNSPIATAEKEVDSDPRTSSGGLLEKLSARLGKTHIGRPLKTKIRQELIASVKPHYWQYFRADNGDLPEGFAPPAQPQPPLTQDLRATA